MSANSAPLRRVIAWRGGARHILECGHQLGRRWFSGLPNMLEAERVNRARCGFCERREPAHVKPTSVARLVAYCRRHQLGAWIDPSTAGTPSRPQLELAL